MHYEIGIKFPFRKKTEAAALALGRALHLAVFRVNDDGTRTRIDDAALTLCYPLDSPQYEGLDPFKGGEEGADE